MEGYCIAASSEVRIQYGSDVSGNLPINPRRKAAAKTRQISQEPQTRFILMEGLPKFHHLPLSAVTSPSTCDVIWHR